MGIVIGQDDLSMQSGHEAGDGKALEKRDLRCVPGFEQGEIGLLDILPRHFAVATQGVET
ncbi:hypothetical protein D9M68_813350 [compost metagenome]